MTKEELIEKINQRWAKIENLENCTTLHEHEKNFVKIWKTLGRVILDSSIGQGPDDPQVKKYIKTKLGALEMSYFNAYYKKQGEQKLSPPLTEK